MSRGKKRADRIRAEVPIQRVLADYGYNVDAAYDGEQQFSCDLHGDGRDNKPSGRVYPSSGSWYCFACDRTRDAIETVREKESLDFWAALKALETRHHLPPLPWDDDDRQAAQDRKEHNNTVAAVGELLDPARTFEQDQREIERLLFGATADRDLPMNDVVKFWEVYDKIGYLLEQGRLDEQTARQGLRRVHTLVLLKYKEQG